jgi:imidazolonepropionase-like amidohydrolase
MLAIINARLETISNGTIENGSMLIKDGKISKEKEFHFPLPQIILLLMPVTLF